MKPVLRKKIELAKDKRKEINKFLGKLEKKTPKNLDNLFHVAHEKAFAKIDCLDCANCCKTTSPIFYDKDIERMAAHFRIKSAVFYDKYLKTDEEGDQVLKGSPCPFLLADNKCLAYDSRPKACREFPHTNRKRMHQILDITAKNTRLCPAAADIVNTLMI